MGEVIELKIWIPRDQRICIRIIDEFNAANIGYCIDCNGQICYSSIDDKKRGDEIIARIIREEAKS